MSLRSVLIAALILMATALAALPHVTTTAHVMTQAVADGSRRRLRDGRVLQLPGKAYGRTHLGNIQGVAQALTVFASAIGPLLLASWRPHSGGRHHWRVSKPTLKGSAHIKAR